jgi:hypothetical protein
MSRGIAKSIIKNGRFWRLGKNGNLSKVTIACGAAVELTSITKYTKVAIFAEIGKKTPMFARFSSVAGERGAADAERDIRGFARPQLGIAQVREKLWKIFSRVSPIGRNIAHKGRLAGAGAYAYTTRQY